MIDYSNSIWSLMNGISVRADTHDWWVYMIKTGHRPHLENAVAHLINCNADPGVFAKDWRYFVRHAALAEWRAFFTMQGDSLYALMGQNMIAIEETLDEGFHAFMDQDLQRG